MLSWFSNVRNLSENNDRRNTQSIVGKTTVLIFDSLLRKRLGSAACEAALSSDNQFPPFPRSHSRFDHVILLQIRQQQNQMNRAGFAGGFGSCEGAAMRMTSNRFSSGTQPRGAYGVGSHRADQSSQWSAICGIAPKISCRADTSRRWVHREERDATRGPASHD